MARLCVIISLLSSLPSPNPAFPRLNSPHLQEFFNLGTLEMLRGHFKGTSSGLQLSKQAWGGGKACVSPLLPSKPAQTGRRKFPSNSLFFHLPPPPPASTVQKEELLFPPSHYLQRPPPIPCLALTCPLPFSHFRGWLFAGGSRRKSQAETYFPALIPFCLKDFFSPPFAQGRGSVIRGEAWGADRLQRLGKGEKNTYLLLVQASQNKGEAAPALAEACGVQAAAASTALGCVAKEGGSTSSCPGLFPATCSSGVRV